MFHFAANSFALSSVRAAIDTTSTSSIFARALTWISPMAPVPARQIFIEPPRRGGSEEQDPPCTLGGSAEQDPPYTAEHLNLHQLQYRRIGLSTSNRRCRSGVVAMCGM